AAHVQVVGAGQGLLRRSALPRRANGAGDGDLFLAAFCAHQRIRRFGIGAIEHLRAGKTLAVDLRVADEVHPKPLLLVVTTDVETFVPVAAAAPWHPFVSGPGQPADTSDGTALHEWQHGSLGSSAHLAVPLPNDGELRIARNPCPELRTEQSFSSVR